MGVSYQQEFLATCFDEAMPLFTAHWREVALDRDTIPLNIDRDYYEQAEASGALKVFTARAAGRLVGYFALICIRSPHYKDHIFAMNDVLYVDPALRGIGRVAMRLVQFAEDHLRTDGVSLMIVNTKVHKPFDRLLEAAGYTQAERLYRKRL
jgi:GNAT superfamily N-acetyltransferase